MYKYGAVAYPPPWAKLLLISKKKYGTGKRKFCSMNLKKISGKGFFEIKPWPFNLPLSLWPISLDLILHVSQALKRTTYNFENLYSPNFVFIHKVLLNGKFMITIVSYYSNRKLSNFAIGISN